MDVEAFAKYWSSFILGYGTETGGHVGALLQHFAAALWWFLGSLADITNAKPLGAIPYVSSFFFLGALADIFTNAKPLFAIPYVTCKKKPQS